MFCPHTPSTQGMQPSCLQLCTNKNKKETISLWSNIMHTNRTSLLLHECTLAFTIHWYILFLSRMRTLLLLLSTSGVFHFLPAEIRTLRATIMLFSFMLILRAVLLFIMATAGPLGKGALAVGLILHNEPFSHLFSE